MKSKNVIGASEAPSSILSTQQLPALGLHSSFVEQCYLLRKYLPGWTHVNGALKLASSIELPRTYLHALLLARVLQSGLHVVSLADQTNLFLLKCPINCLYYCPALFSHSPCPHKQARSSLLGPPGRLISRALRPLRQRYPRFRLALVAVLSAPFLPCVTAMPRHL